MKNRQSHSQLAYAAIRERITSGELASGAMVSEAAIAKELGLSRTPVGEALRRLSHEGLVDQIPRYGTVVRSLSQEDLRELFEIRQALEGMAAAKAADRITAEVLEELELLCVAIDTEITSAQSSGATALEGEALNRFLAADMAFHMLIISSARNRRLGDILEQTRSISSMFYARRGVHSLQRVIDANDWHRKILAALVARDSARASELVINHIQHSCDQSLRSEDNGDAPINLGTLNLPPSMRMALKAVTK
ncbi:GntR family transcriptional regulator [Aeoliella sp.]|uniref:GntR family transcriptional regulator n=1 Tax=Aeoliella sp. TaxID=2795800 RepID=UPI003CCBFD73